MESQRWQLGGSRKDPVNPINDGRWLENNKSVLKSAVGELELQSCGVLMELTAKETKKKPPLSVQPKPVPVYICLSKKDIMTLYL